MLDTSVAIHLRDGDSEVIDRLSRLSGEAVISIVTHVELEGGVYRDPAESARRRARLDSMLEDLTVLSFDRPAAEAYGRMLSVVGFSRTRILDRMIAAHAIATGVPLVTANVADFQDLPHLQLADW